VVADSLDEIHPDDYLFVLEQLERISLAADQEFIHLVVFGRPFAFRDFWNNRETAKSQPTLNRFLLNKPELRTTGDLALSNWNYSSRTRKR